MNEAIMRGLLESIIARNMVATGHVDPNRQPKDEINVIRVYNRCPAIPDTVVLRVWIYHNNGVLTISEAGRYGSTDFNLADSNSIDKIVDYTQSRIKFWEILQQTCDIDNWL